MLRPRIEVCHILEWWVISKRTCGGYNGIVSEAETFLQKPFCLVTRVKCVYSNAYRPYKVPYKVPWKLWVR